MIRHEGLPPALTARLALAELPGEGCVRLLDLPSGVRGVIALGEDGFASIYLNARLARRQRWDELAHELKHLLRGDMYSDADIRQIESAPPAVPPAEPEPFIAPLAELPAEPEPSIAPLDVPEPLQALDGRPLKSPAPVFPIEGLRRVGRGLYLPVGGTLERAMADLAAIWASMGGALRMFDVMQRPPLLPVGMLKDALGVPDAGDIAFIGWTPHDGGEWELPAVMQLCRDTPDGLPRLRGAAYYRPDGAVDSALMRLYVSCRGRRFEIGADLRRSPRGLAVCRITRAADAVGAEEETLYGGA